MYFPINVDIREKKCLVVGGGDVAQRKVHSLLQAGGKVRVVSPEINSEISQLADQKRVELKKGRFHSTDIEKDTFLVIGATNQPEVQREIYEIATRQNKLVNIVDEPKWCNFTVPSKIERGKLMLTISTHGASPALTRHLRLKLESQFGEEYKVLLDWLSDLRGELKEKVQSQSERKAIYGAVLESEILNLIKQGKLEEAKQRLGQLT